MSPELRLIAACCRWPVDSESVERVSSLAAEVTNWPRVVALTRSHRVEGLVWNALRKAEVALPPDTASKLAGMAEEVRLDGIRAIGEALRVGAVLQKAGIPFLVIKGLPLAMQSYGTATIKNSIDLDLLVKPADVVRTAALLVDLGYKTMRPWRPLDADEFARWSAVAKEAWMVSDRGQVDLHWDLLDQPDLLAGLDPWATTKEVELLPGHSMPTMGDPAHLGYVAAHGAMSGWSRLKWLADFAAFISARPAAERESLCSEARKIGDSRCMDQGLALANRLLGPGSVPQPRADGDAEGLAVMAERLIVMRKPGQVLEKEWRGAHLISKMQWGLRPGARYKWLEARRRFRDQEIRFRLRLPVHRRFQWIFFPLRLFGICSILGQSLVRRPRSEL